MKQRFLLTIATAALLTTCVPVYAAQQGSAPSGQQPSGSAGSGSAGQGSGSQGSAGAGFTGLRLTGFRRTGLSRIRIRRLWFAGLGWTRVPDPRARPRQNITNTRKAARARVLAPAVRGRAPAPVARAKVLAAAVRASSLLNSRGSCYLALTTSIIPASLPSQAAAPVRVSFCAASSQCRCVIWLSPFSYP